jgi:hypothetical protein
VLEGYDPRIHAVFFCPQLDLPLQSSSTWS